MTHGITKMEEIVFGLDIGTTKVCAVVGEVREGKLQIIGLGQEPSRGMRKGMIVDVAPATIAIAKLTPIPRSPRPGWPASPEASLLPRLVRRGWSRRIRAGWRR